MVKAAFSSQISSSAFLARSSCELSWLQGGTTAAMHQAVPCCSRQWVVCDLSQGLRHCSRCSGELWTWSSIHRRRLWCRHPLVLEILDYVMRQGATQILHGLEGDGCCCCDAILTVLLFVDLFRRLSPGSTTTHLCLSLQGDDCFDVVNILLHLRVSLSRIISFFACTEGLLQWQQKVPDLALDPNAPDCILLLGSFVFF